MSPQRTKTAGCGRGGRSRSSDLASLLCAHAILLRAGCSSVKGTDMMDFAHPDLSCGQGRCQAQRPRSPRGRTRIVHRQRAYLRGRRSRDSWPDLPPSTYAYEFYVTCVWLTGATLPLFRGTSHPTALATRRAGCRRDLRSARRRHSAVVAPWASGSSAFELHRDPPRCVGHPRSCRSGRAFRRSSAVRFAGLCPLGWQLRQVCAKSPLADKVPPFCAHPRQSAPKNARLRRLSR